MNYSLGNDFLEKGLFANFLLETLNGKGRDREEEEEESNRRERGSNMERDREEALLIYIPNKIYQTSLSKSQFPG